MLVNKVRIHIDKAINGGVRTPALIRLGNISQAPITFDTLGLLQPGTQGWIELDGFSFSGSVLDMQLFQDGGDFVMVSEVEFFGFNSAVPEPATWLMMILGLGFIGASIRTAKRRPRPRQA
ncbi:MAG: PEPxxWA-CTERM sorting domain-containing protein [Parvularcula sp.]|nr:PEPxxWA-CTERM sorting domain-containing protein [Parvularcula sp.]